LLEEQCTFSAESVLPLEGFSSNSISRCRLALGTGYVIFVAVSL